MNKKILTAAESEFMSEDEIIEITPSFRLPVISLASGTFGPFRPAVPVRVPIWLAIMLKTSNKCRIKVPTWMEVENLKQLVDIERSTSEWRKVPYFYQEIASQLLSVAADDIPNLEAVRILLRDLDELRFDKLRSSTQSVQAGSIVKLNSICSMELTFVRSHLSTVLNQIVKLESARQITDPQQDMPQQAPAVPPRRLRRFEQ